MPVPVHLVVVLLIAGALVPTMLSAQSRSQTQPALDSALAQAHAHWRHALSSSNADTVASAFTEDLLAMEAGVPDVVGREGVRRRTAEVFSSRRMRMLDLAPVTLSAVFAGDSLISEAGVYVERLQVEGREPFNLISHYMTIWRLINDGVWRIHRVVQHLE